MKKQVLFVLSCILLLGFNSCMVTGHTKCPTSTFSSHRTGAHHPSTGYAYMGNHHKQKPKTATAEAKKPQAQPVQQPEQMDGLAFGSLSAGNDKINIKISIR